MQLIFGLLVVILADSASHLGDVRILNSIIDMDELRELITKLCEEKGLI